MSKNIKKITNKNKHPLNQDKLSFEQNKNEEQSELDKMWNYLKDRDEKE